MQTQLPQDLLASEHGQTADHILRACVHCGFCLSTCPTYHLLGDELDSPRGRIYLIKQALEGHEVTDRTRIHLDRCLTCRACETTCPSGVEYGHLLDIGRQVVETKTTRPWWQRSARFLVRKTLTTPTLFNSLVKVAPWVKHSRAERPLLDWHRATQRGAQAELTERKVLLLSGCVQPALAPNINLATQKVLNKLGIGVIETPQSQCCGAIDHHMSAEEDTLTRVKANIDAWIPYLNTGVEAIISNASGCGVMVKDYAHLLRADSEYAEKAQRIVDATQDIAEFLADEDLSVFERIGHREIVFHSPCTLQHGQKRPGLVESTLTRLGFHLHPVADSHLCCGSAGTYSLFQPKLSNELRTRKLTALNAEQPDMIVTANIGCLMHLQKGTDTPVKHWIELL